jgi:hypothetical protein
MEAVSQAKGGTFRTVLIIAGVVVAVSVLAFLAVTNKVDITSLVVNAAENCH